MENTTKRIITILLTICFFTTVYSQTLQLKEFVQKELDLSARIHRRKDENGDTCALVKVQLALPEAKFEGMIIGKTELRVSTYWVYMSPGSKRMSISVPGFLPLDIEFAKYNIKSLKSQTTYVATIEVPTEMLAKVNAAANRVAFIKKSSIYLGGGYTLGASSGATFFAGGTFLNINAEIAYTLGIGNSSEVGWYAKSNEALTEVNTYKLNCFTAKIGYQLAFAKRFGIMPQVGYKAQILKSSGNRGNGVSCGSATIGVKLMVPIIKNMRFFVDPEYAFVIQKSDTYTNISKLTNFQEGGFYVTGGLMFNF